MRAGAREPAAPPGAWAGALATVVALLPIVGAAARAARLGWVPLGDNAIYAIRALDVLSPGHLPTLGTWSAGSRGASLDYHHPGPLLFDVLAVPVWVLGLRGAALGVAAVNGAAVVVTSVFAYRRQGALGSLVAVLVAATLCWSMGSAVLIEPWNPHSMMLPFLAFLFLTWSIACGDLVALPIAAAAGSLVAQTHLSYVLLVAVLGAWAVGALVVRLRARRHEDPDGWPALRRRALGAGAVGAAVVVVCWAQPLGEQFFGEGKGNLSRIVEASTGDQSSGIGISDAVRVVADVVAVPPAWLPSSFARPWQIAFFPSGTPRPAFAVAGLVVLAGVLAACAVVARRRWDGVLATAAVTAGVALAVALVDATSAPLTVAGVPYHHFRWLWPLGAFFAFVVLSTVLHLVVRERPDPTRWAAVVLAGCLVLVVAAALPASDRASQPNWAIPVARRVARQLDELESGGPYFVRSPSLNDHFTMALLAELRMRRIRFVVDESLSRQVGEERRFDDNADRELRVLLGPDSGTNLPAGTQVVARDRGPLSPAQRRELTRRREDLVDQLDGSLRTRVHPEAESYVAPGQYPTLRRQLRTGRWAPQDLLEAGELVSLIQTGLVLTDDHEADLAEQVRRLQERLDEGTVTVVLTNVDREVARS